MTELAEIIRVHGPEYLAKHTDRMLPSHNKAMCDIVLCRTPALGGRVYTCSKGCDHHDYSYHSCNNRACPKCENDDATEWIRQQEALLLPCDYFLITTTVPHELHPVAKSNQKIVYGKFLYCSAQAIMQLVRDPRFIGGQTGCVGVLQTWDRAMGFHLHAHFIVPAGALSDEAKRWLRPKKPDFLIHEKPLAKLLRGKFKAAMKKHGLYSQIPAAVWKKNWVADSEYVGSARQAIKYLSPYVRRIAISNKRIELLHNGRVTFRYKPSGCKFYKRMCLPAEKFISRFLQHVLPKGFQKIRYYGLLHPKAREKLNRARALLGAGPYEKPGKTTRDPETGYRTCPHCGAPLIFLVELAPQMNRGPPCFAV